MAKTDKEKFLKYNGYKFFKCEEGSDTAEIVRIIGMKEFNEKFKIKDENTGKIRTIPYSTLKNEYTPLEPRGFIMFINVWIEDVKGYKSDDIIVAAYDMNHLKIFNDQVPYVICRQSINDIFYTTIQTDPNLEVVGCCISKDTVPPNLNMTELLQCSGVYSSQIVNFYIEDTIETVLECIDVTVHDELLEKLFKEHMLAKNSGNPLFDYNACTVRQNDGWCRTLQTLLHENNFITDFDAMRNIQALDFDLSKYIINSEDMTYLSEDIVVWISRTYRIPLKKAPIVEYDHDIDLADFADSPYMLFRDSTDTTYLVLYVCEGEFLEEELEKKYQQLSPSEEIRLAFYNKYQGLVGESYKDIIKN